MDSAGSLAHRAQVDRFFREHHESVLRDANATLRRFPALAPFLSGEDLLHETYLSYVSYVESGRPITSSGEPAFRKVTLRRKAIDHLRSGRRREAGPIEEDLPQEPVERFEPDLIDRVVAALAGLRETRPIYFELLHMTFFLGLRVQQVAALLGERENTISVRKRRALEALKCEMAKLGVRMQTEPDGDDDPDGDGSGPGRGTTGVAGSRLAATRMAASKVPGTTIPGTRIAVTRIAGMTDMSGTRPVFQNLPWPAPMIDDGGPDAERPDLLCLAADLSESLLGLALATKLIDRSSPLPGDAVPHLTAHLAAALLHRASLQGWRSRN